MIGNASRRFCEAVIDSTNIVPAFKFSVTSLSNCSPLFGPPKHSKMLTVILITTSIQLQIYFTILDQLSAHNSLNMKLKQQFILMPLTKNVHLTHLVWSNENLILVSLVGQGSKTDVILSAATRRGESRDRGGGSKRLPIITTRHDSFSVEYHSSHRQVSGRHGTEIRPHSRVCEWDRNEQNQGKFNRPSISFKDLGVLRNHQVFGLAFSFFFLLKVKCVNE